MPMANQRLESFTVLYDYVAYFRVIYFQEKLFKVISLFILIFPIVMNLLRF